MTIIEKVMAFIDKIRFSFGKLFRLRGHGISILVPFHSSDANNQRAKNWKWLYKYWRKQLPGAEIIVGVDAEAGINGKPFSKSCAVNNAVSRASGDIFVIVDADGYVPISTIIECAEEIRKARKLKKKLWFVPYRNFYRLTEAASQNVLQSDPAHPYLFGKKPSEDDVLNMADFTGTSGSAIGHWYGALIQLMPCEAFEAVGGWDPRFRGWGGEDSSAMRAMDTLYWPHKTIPGPVFHIWHPFKTVQSTNSYLSRHRLWENQGTANANNILSNRYFKAQGNVVTMIKLVSEWKKPSNTKLAK
jgi:hypothetical protein